MINEVKLIDNIVPTTLPVNGHDRYNYLVKYAGSNTQLQAVVLFDRNLDEDILKKAVRLSLDAEPVLGCRFIEDEKQPYWQRFEEPDEIPWYHLLLWPWVLIGLSYPVFFIYHGRLSG
jgi:NRPS condensation-like uncharacterized protein